MGTSIPNKPQLITQRRCGLQAAPKENVRVRRRPRLLKKIYSNYNNYSNYTTPSKKNCHFVSLTLTKPLWHRV